MEHFKNEELHNKFLTLYVKEGKSIQTIAKELGIDQQQAFNLEDELEFEIMDLKAVEYDKIVQDFGLSQLQQFEYLAELYKRLKKELDKRDFTGLPTDKLYSILMDVTFQINHSLKSSLEDDFHDHDDWDDIDDEDEIF